METITLKDENGEDLVFSKDELQAAIRSLAGGAAREPRKADRPTARRVSFAVPPKRADYYTIIYSGNYGKIDPKHAPGMIMNVRFSKPDGSDPIEGPIRAGLNFVPASHYSGEHLPIFGHCNRLITIIPPGHKVPTLDLVTLQHWHWTITTEPNCPNPAAQLECLHSFIPKKGGPEFAKLRKDVASQAVAARRWAADHGSEQEGDDFEDGATELDAGLDRVQRQLDGLD